SGESPWPIAPEEWEARAAEVLEPGPFDYIAGGAGSEATMRANLEAFERRRLRPRMLTGNSERDISVEVLGTTSPAPFLLAPIGVLSIAHAEGELAAARAAAATGVPMVLSSAASHSIEEVAEAMGGAQRWFQLYWVNDRDVAVSLVERAEAAGYGAIVVTLDTLTLGWRPRDLSKAYLPFVTGEGCAQFFSDPVFRSKLERPPEEDVLAAAVAMLATFPNLGLSWDDLAWLRDRTKLPLLVKGVLTGEDALRARECGVDGIVVSNHGGRQVDGAVAALDALVEVREAVGPEAAVLMDGGIRRGADVLKALALGADAVLLGRPYAYGLAVGGQEGVETVIHHLMAETDLTLALIGGTRAAGLDSSWIAASS
ncbi:MAG TPA: alpha-hydroxy-acid oxidizing protein, partial [Solirubrobacteraceae bacterium]|nr:alpha-hydroxy-acid oxidizing protein [Solirubrobacteraceae bacterium]